MSERLPLLISEAEITQEIDVLRADCRAFRLAHADVAMGLLTVMQVYDRLEKHLEQLEARLKGVEQ